MGGGGAQTKKVVEEEKSFIAQNILDPVRSIDSVEGLMLYRKIL